MEFVLCRFIAADTFVSRYSHRHTHDKHSVAVAVVPYKQLLN